MCFIKTAFKKKKSADKQLKTVETAQRTWKSMLHLIKHKKSENKQLRRIQNVKNMSLK